MNEKSRPRTAQTLRETDKLAESYIVDSQSDYIKSTAQTCVYIHNLETGRSSGTSEKCPPRTSKNLSKMEKASEGCISIGSCYEYKKFTAQTCVYIHILEREYLDDLLKKGRRPTTIEDYRTQLDIIIPILEEVIGKDVPLSNITQQDVRAIYQAMDVCENSKKTYLGALGRMIEYHTGKNPVRDAGILWNVPSKRRKWIKESEWPKIKEAARNSLDRLVLYLGAMMGLRRAEMVRIKLSDIKNGEIKVKGKGHGPDGKVDYLPMPKEVERALQDYLRDRDKVGSESDKLLIRIDGRMVGKEIDERGIRYIIDGIGKRAGVDFSPHSLRRLFATVAYQHTDINTLKKLMRHADVNTTLECYIYADPEKINSTRETVATILG